MSGHWLHMPWRRRGCGQGRSKTGGGRISLRNISQTDPFMNCEQGRSKCRGQSGSCDGGTMILTRRRRETEIERKRRRRKGETDKSVV